MCSISPSLLNYFYIPAIAMVVLLGFFVFYNNYRRISNRLFFIFSIVIALWMLFNMLNFASTDFDMVLLYDKLSIIGVFIPVIFFVFIYFFFNDLDDKGIILKKTYFLFFLPTVPFILFSATKYNVRGLTPPPECETIAGPLYWFFILATIFYIVLSLLIFYKKFKTGNKEAKKQIKIILFGFIVSSVWVLVTNGILQLSGFSEASLLAPIGAIFLFLSISYSIVKYQFLNIKLIATQALVIGLFILIGSQFFFIRSFTNQILTGITLTLSIIFGWVLIRSVKIEIERKNELQMMADQLAVANDKLRKLDNAKSEFISIASHQLRTPLTAIKGFISLILEGSYGKINAEIKDVLNKVYLSNERLIELVEDLLNLSRIESGRMEYKFEKINLGEVCQEIYDTFVLRAKEKNLDLDLVLDKNLMMEAVTDRNKIREVISNLVDNGLKYTLKGGVKIKLTEIEEKIQIAIIDTGIGVPEEEIPYLFSKFSRGKDISRLNAGGTGLGLHVGKKMIEALGGRIWVQSAGTNLGSTFFMEVPKERGEEN